MPLIPQNDSRLCSRSFSFLLALILGWLSLGPSSHGVPELSALQVNVNDKEGISIPLVFSANPTLEEFLAARVFDEPLVPVGAKPSPDENRALAKALQEYAERRSPDQFPSITHFLKQYPGSPWRAAVLTGLGVEYYNAAYYSRALEAWEEAWALGQKATDAGGKLLADRAVCELASLYSKLGRMKELEALLDSVKGRVFLGGAPERISLAREALSMMQYQPGVSFRCGPLALLSIQRSLNPQAEGGAEISNAASTQQGFSLSQVAELSRKIGLNYQLAFRQMGAEFVVPSVVHWRVGHYAALLRQVGDHYLLEDPTFGNRVWATREALEAETSGYFLAAQGKLPTGWRSVDAREGATIWGKGITSGIDPDNYTPEDMQGGSCPVEEMGMAISRVHLGVVSLQIRDTPLGYSPPVGPPVRFTVRYNQRDYVQQPSQISTLFGAKWTHDWYGYIKDNPANPLADVKYFVGGGGARTFTDFSTNTQTFASQQFDQTRLRRAGANSYEMTFPDGSRKLFGLRAGTSVYLTQVVDPAGNAVTLNWSGGRLVSLTDAIGQVTTISYEHGSAPQLITRVTDPFGRFAKFDYGHFDLPIDAINPTNLVRVYVLTNITDVLGLQSAFQYSGDTNIFINRMNTPYGATTFITGQGGGPSGTTRWVETSYPDGSRDRVEYNQNTNGIAFSDPGDKVPQGMNVFNQYLHGRNTFYWDRNACAKGYGDYSKATIYHWLHAQNTATTAGILESVKRPLENRVWFNYPGQVSPYHTVGSSDRPARVGRVLDDGTTQLDSYAYNALGRVTSSIDPLGRELNYIYATNGIDLLEVRQTRGTNNDLLLRMTYNNQHLPLTMTDAAGQTTTFTYNARGQMLTEANPKGATNIYSYNTNGYLIAVDGPLPGTNDLFAATYDAFGRMQTLTDESGYTLTFDYDPLDRPTQITYPDATFSRYTYERLDLTAFRDSAGRLTSFEYDSIRQLRRKIDPMGRVTRFQWCSCGSLDSMTDPLGRTTQWTTDIQGRPISKQYADGSKISYFYENTTSRLRQVIDEKQQVGQYVYNRDDTLKSVVYANTTIPTPGVSYTYDPNYKRVISMTDGLGTTVYSYNPITGSPGLGAGKLASVDGPLPGDTIAYGYDELGRRVSTAINGVATRATYDEAGRLVAETNALGIFTYGYDAGSGRLVSQTFPNNQAGELSYGNNLQDRALQRITHKLGATLLSEFIYGRNVPAGRIETWSQQAGALPPNLLTLGYDDVNQLLSVSVTNAGVLVNSFGYAYDPAGNRLAEQDGASRYTATYNALNQVSASTKPGVSRTKEWDAQDRLVAINTGHQRTEFTYDGLSRLANVRQLTNGVEASFRRLVWCGEQVCEERDAAGVVTKRFFAQGMRVESGPAAGNYFYTQDHLGSIREVTDSSGTVRARYTYDPYGRRTRVAGDLEADFGFAGMFWSSEAGLSLTHYRAYDPSLGRWLSRDPLPNAEMREGPNLYAYVANNPVNLIDPDGLMSTMKTCLTPANAPACAAAGLTAARTAPEVAQRAAPYAGQAAACLSRMPTLPGLGSDTVNVMANTVPALTRTAPALAQTIPAATRVAPNLNQAYQMARYARAWEGSLQRPSDRFWQAWVDASRQWREYDLTQEQAREAMTWISRWADTLF